MVGTDFVGCVKLKGRVVLILQVKTDSYSQSASCNCIAIFRRHIHLQRSDNELVESTNSIGCREVAMTRGSILIVLLIVLPMGCASISDYRFRSATERRAKLAWREIKSSLSEDDRSVDFADGFQAGYVDVCRGGDGTCPAIPPSCYWDAKFQSADGIRRVNKWYCGFSRGASDAQRSRANQGNNVPSSASVFQVSHSVNGLLVNAE